MPPLPDERTPTRHTLLNRLKNLDDQDSWREFFNLYWRFIYAAAAKSGLTDAEAQDVVQETVLAVSRKIGKFRYDPSVGSFRAWLIAVTRWKIAERRRRRGREFGQEHIDSVSGAVEECSGASASWAGELAVRPQVEALWESEWRQQVIELALEQVKRRVNPKHYQIFDFYVVRGWPLSRVTAALNVSDAQVYLAKSRISRLLKDAVKQIQARVL